jgi:hypothetical protein
MVQEMLRVAHRESLHTTAALADTVLKNSSESSCALMHIPVPRYFLPCLSFARDVVNGLSETIPLTVFPDY